MNRTDKALSSTICHEWGHALVNFLLYGEKSGLESIEIIDTVYRVDGHTSFLAEDVSLENKIMILFGGIAAEHICGYTRVLMHRGTDAQKLKALLPQKRERDKYAEKVVSMLEPYKASLELLTHNTVEQLPERDNENCMYHRIIRDELRELLSEAIKLKMT